MAGRDPNANELEEIIRIMLRRLCYEVLEDGPAWINYPVYIDHSVVIEEIRIVFANGQNICHMLYGPVNGYTARLDEGSPDALNRVLAEVAGAHVHSVIYEHLRSLPPNREKYYQAETQREIRGLENQLRQSRPRSAGQSNLLDNLRRMQDRLKHLNWMYGRDAASEFRQNSLKTIEQRQREVRSYRPRVNFETYHEDYLAPIPDIHFRSMRINDMADAMAYAFSEATTSSNEQEAPTTLCLEDIPPMWTEYQQVFGVPVPPSKEATEKAEKLLKDNLSPSQLAMLEKSNKFNVKGGSSGQMYTIARGRQMNVWIEGTDEIECGRCFIPAGNLPEGDVMLAQKLAIECDEDAAMAVANKFTPAHKRRDKLTETIGVQAQIEDRVFNSLIRSHSWDQYFPRTRRSVFVDPQAE